MNKNKKVLFTLISTSLIAVLSASIIYTGCGEETKPTLKLHQAQWDSFFLLNAILKIIITEGYRYPVELIEMTHRMMKKEIAIGQIDLSIECWRQNWIDEYNKQIKNGNILNLGITYNKSHQFFIIPKWVGDKYRIRKIEDMKDHWVLFKDYEYATKGVFYNGISGWSATNINNVKLKAYGLDRYYNSKILPSAEAMTTILERAQQNHRPIFGYYWTPTALMGEYEWTVLKEPVYYEACWGKIEATARDRSSGPVDCACSYPSFSITKIAHKSLKNKAPDVVEMLNKMRVEEKSLLKSLAWAKRNQIRQWNAAAIYYLAEYQSEWKVWVSPKAFERLKKALGRSS